MKVALLKLKSALLGICIGALTVLGFFVAFFLRKKGTQLTTNLEETVSTKVKVSEKLAKAEAQVKDVEHSAAVKEVERAAENKAESLERKPSALADALTRLSDD